MRQVNPGKPAPIAEQWSHITVKWKTVYPTFLGNAFRIIFDNGREIVLVNPWRR